MLPHLTCAVTSIFFLSSSLLAAGPYISAVTALDPTRSSMTLRAQSDVLPGPLREVGITHGELHADGAVEMILALNAFSGTAKMPELRRWTHLFEDFEAPRGMIRTALTRQTVFNMMSGPDAVFDLPLEITLNGASQVIHARMAGSMQAGARVILATHQPVSFDLAQFGIGSVPQVVTMQIHVSYGQQPEIEPVPETWVHMVSLALPEAQTFTAVDHAVAVSLRPEQRPAKIAQRRPTLRPSKTAQAKAKPARAADKKQLVTITHKLRPAPIKTAKECSEHHRRVARGETVLEGNTREERGMKRAMRKLTQALRSCR